MICNLCPYNCNIDRNLKTGACHAGSRPNVAKVMLHHWEEPCISGTRGSGGVFFSGCNMHCKFCQNYLLNDGTAGEPKTPGQLCEIFLDLQKQGAHNINLVTPSPHVETIIPSIESARKQGLSIPIVYNTNAYEKVETLKRLEGLVDIYLPDFKYINSILSKKFSGCPDYAEYAEKAILEMFRQVGLIQKDENGIATRGMIIRHLVLPTCVFDSRDVLKRISEILPLDISISIMGQYTPTEQVKDLSPLNRKITRREYDQVLDYAISLGFTNLNMQDLSSAKSCYTPDFLH